jgi:hypothetical protein
MDTHQTESECVTVPVHNHMVRICPNTTSQAEVLTRYIKDGLLNNEGIIIIARPPLRRAVLSKLEVLGFDSQAIKNQGQVRFFDAEFLLSNILIDGIIEEQAFRKFIGIPIQATQSKFGKVRAFGEMVDILWQRDLQNMAIQLENLWEDLCAKQGLIFLCTYLLDNLDPNDYDSALEKIYKHHKHLALDLFSPELGEAIQDALGEAWNRVLDKLAKTNQATPQASLNLNSPAS